MQMNQPIRAGRLILTLAALILCALNSSASFTYTYEGSTLSYSTIDSYAVQCTGKWNLAEDLIIPEEVTDEEGQTYKVTKIGNQAFYNCTSLASVTIPNSVTEIGGGAFKRCSLLTSVTIPNSVTKIGIEAFYGCSSLTSVTIPNSVTEIGYYAFSHCTNLTAVYISDLTAWCNISFGGYDANPLFYAHNLYLNGNLITDLVIPNSITVINDYAFEGYSSLTSVTIPNSVTEIGYNAFRDCSSLTSVIIPNSVTKIGRYAFSDCSSLTFITIGDSVTKIDGDAFSGCDKLIAVYISDLTAWCNISFESSYSNPVCYAHILYLNGNLLTDLVIPDSITIINDYAFYDCASLTSVTIPNSVTKIGDYAFRNCSSLTSVTIPNSVTEIGDAAFSGCDKLIAVYISDLTAWCNISFESSYSNPACYAHTLYLNGNLLTDLVIPDSITIINDYAFYDCASMTSVTIPNSVTKIGKSTFEGCHSLTSVTIPNSVTEIGIEAFRRCTSLTSVDIPNSVTEIGNNAFEECTSLTSVDIPNSITEIDKEAFQGCSSLTFVTIPNSVTKIGEKAFEYCYSLKEITLPESVTEIGSDAFRQSGLTELTVLNPIPPTVDNDYAFSNPENIALYVPEGSVDFYRLREPWSRFKSINAVDTAIEGVEVEADVAVSVCGAEIVVPEGSKIFDLKGRAMRATKLPAGVYIVRTPSGKTVKVTIAHP